MRKSLGIAAITAALVCGTAYAQQKPMTLKVGVLTDMASIYADDTGQGAVAAAQLAAQDFMKDHKNIKVEVVSADHQNKPDVGTGIASKWFDVDHVDMITGVPTSSVALAVMQVAAQKNKALIDSGAGSSDITGSKCNANTVHWTYDTWMLANGTGKAIVKNGGDTWFFITADYAFGAALERDTTAVVTANGGKVVGGVKHPLNTPDFSSFMLQAQQSKAKIIGLANAGGDTTNTIKQAAEFGIGKGGQKLAALLLFLTDVKAIGLETAQGLNFTETFYWDMDDKTRAFSKRFSDKMKNNAPPTMVQAGVYAGVRHYLKALEALGGYPHDGVKVVEKMKSLPTEDDLFGKGEIQPNGRTIHSAYLFEVKKPSESKGPWDFYKLVGTVPGDQAFTPLSESKCALLKK